MSSKKKSSCKDTCRFYWTAFFILVAIFSSFTFVFLVPFVIDPAFTTLFAEFEEQPRTCVTIFAQSLFGLSNCTWSSCREGCTREVFQCTQVYVHYKLDVAHQLEGQNFTDSYENMTFDYYNAKLYPNVKGCGYPPAVNCTIFNSQYAKKGYVFNCFYSKIKPDLVLTSLDIEQTKLDLIYSIAIPWVCFLVSLLYLLITYCGMKKPELESADEPQEITSSKASKEASNYSLRSISKTINQGFKFMGDQDDRGSFSLLSYENDSDND